MPFTLSHIAATLPLQGATRTGTAPGEGGGRRGPLIASALVFGAMAPDVVLFVDLGFLPGHVDRAATHHLWPGVLAVDVVLTAVLAVAFHLLARPALLLLPDTVRGRLTEPLRPHLPGRLFRAARRGEPFAREGLKAAGWFLGSAVLGGLTHLGWDAWTHHDDPGVAHVLPELRREFFGLRPGYVLLQHLSTAVGLVFVIVAAVRRTRALPERAPDGPGLPGAARALVLAGLLLAGTLEALRTALPFPDGRTPTFETLGFDVATGFGRGLAAGLVVYAAGEALWRVRSRRRAVPAAAHGR